MNLYSLRTEGDRLRITKFNSDLEPESSYLLTATTCECPQFVNREKQCRHLKMYPLMLSRVDTPWFFCYEDGTWHDPLNQANAYAGEGPEPSTLAAEQNTSPSQDAPSTGSPDRRGGPAPTIRRRF